MHTNYICLGFLLFFVVFVAGRVLSIHRRYKRKPSPELKSLRLIVASAIPVLLALIGYVFVDVDRWYFEETWVKGSIYIFGYVVFGFVCNAVFSKFENIVLNDTVEKQDGNYKPGKR